MCFRSINEEKWYLVSGCAKHMTRDISVFSYHKNKDGGYVTYGDNAKGIIVEEVT